jgi:hypothetical protein
MTADYRCSFCGQHQDDVHRLVAGARVFICDRCARTCAENFSGGIPATIPFLEKRPRHATNTVHGSDARCSFCRKRWDDVQWIVQGPRKDLICAECVWLVIQIIDEPPPSGPTARVHRQPVGRSSRTWFRWPWQARNMDKAVSL